ncbi:MAG TPA: DUF1570 domain-containing protein, partial [Candidatus Polarisedimenticolia bacterium]|nr:DUF1570 domain-containing protein [Candidatus Polarisedimenticolia bacterium]
NRFAESLIKGRGYVEARGADWRLRTDLPKSALDDVTKAIEFARAAIDQAFPGRPAAAGTEVTLILFKDEEEYRQLSAFDNLIPERAPVAGQYDPELRFIYSALGNQPVPIFARTMAHEATHHFASLRLSEAHGRVPRWLGEGIAQYVECLKLSKPEKVRLDSLDRGTVAQSTAIVAPGGGISGAWMYSKRVEEAFPNLELNLARVDVEAMVDGRLDGQFFDERALTLYDVSWLLVHYLMNGDSGGHRDAFRAWVVEPSGERNATTLAAAVGVPAAELKPRLRTYLAQIK